MNSSVQAKLHYMGKPHQKKVSQFLNQSVRQAKLAQAQGVTVATPAAIEGSDEAKTEEGTTTTAPAATTAQVISDNVDEYCSVSLPEDNHFQI